MEFQPVCGIVIGSSMGHDAIDELKTDLRLASGIVERPVERDFGLTEVGLVIGIMAGTAQLAESAVKFAKIIIQWRKSMKEKGKPIEGKLEHPQRPTLDLGEATDEEVEEWFQQL